MPFTRSEQLRCDAVTAARGLAMTAAVTLWLTACGGSGSSGTSPAADADGHRICGPTGIGNGHVDAYRQTPDGLPAMRRMADELSHSDKWKAVGQDLVRLVNLGPSSGWSTSQSATASSVLHDLPKDCARTR